MPSNLPEDFRDVEQSAIVGEDSRSLSLTHYVLAERLLQEKYIVGHNAVSEYLHYL